MDWNEIIEKEEKKIKQQKQKQNPQNKGGSFTVHMLLRSLGTRLGVWRGDSPLPRGFVQT